MKLLVTLVLSLSLQFAIAQTQVFSRKTASDQGVDMVKLGQHYDGEVKATKPTFDQINKIIASAFPDTVNPGISVFTQFFFDAAGGVDYLIFDLRTGDGYNIDSLNRHTQNILLKNLTGWRVANPSGKPFQFVSVRNIGKPVVRREVRKSDSSVVDLKTALATVDTLKIKSLYLNQLELKELPNVIYRFKNLEELYLGGNELKEVHIDMSRLPKLGQLHLQNNLLTNNGLTLTKNKSLSVLNLKENKLTDIPSAARNCKKMSSLWLGGDTLSTLSSRSFRRLKQVRDLNFYRSGLTVLPKGIKKMRRLEVLDLYYNELTVLPKSITKLKRLTQLAISHNQINALPANIARLNRVHTLYAHHNHLSTLPKGIVKMQNLQILDLGYNWFTHFPSELTIFKNLKELDLSSNNFSEFPEQLLKISQLEKLYLRGNPFLKDNSETKYGQQLGLLKSKNIEVFY